MIIIISRMMIMMMKKYFDWIAHRKIIIIIIIFLLIALLFFPYLPFFYGFIRVYRGIFVCGFPIFFCQHVRGRYGSWYRNPIKFVLCLWNIIIYIYICVCFWRIRNEIIWRRKSPRKRLRLYTIWYFVQSRMLI